MEKQTNQNEELNESGNVEVIYKLIDLKLRKMNDQIQQIEEWTQMKVGNIIFDSDIDNWKKETSVFTQKIINKSNLIFLIEDEDNNLFGGYINAKIYGSWNFISDPKSFVFSLKPNEMLKFDIQIPQHAILAYSQSSTWLLSIGNGGFDGSQDDINIMKQYCEGHDQFSGCKQSSYNYNGIEHALCGKQTFSPTRIAVIQMI